MRNRLIELMMVMNTTPELTCPRYNIDETCKGCQYEKDDNCDFDTREADYLIANGVIVPPCKVGDKVYVVDCTRLGNMIFECTIEEISHYTYGTYYYLNWGLHIPRFKACQEKSFGKTVFLTREEAEQALQRKEDEGK